MGMWLSVKTLGSILSTGKKKKINQTWFQLAVKLEIIYVLGRSLKLEKPLPII